MTNRNIEKAVMFAHSYGSMRGESKMAGISESEARDREDKSWDSALHDVIGIGMHLSHVNEAGKLRIVLHSEEGNMEESLRVFTTEYRFGSDLLTLHLSRTPQDLSDRLVRFASHIKYEEPKLPFTVIGPAEAYDGDIAVFHLMATSWSDAVKIYRAKYASHVGQIEDPNVMEGHITPLQPNLRLISDLLTK